MDSEWRARKREREKERERERERERRWKDRGCLGAHEPQCLFVSGGQIEVEC